MEYQNCKFTRGGSTILCNYTFLLHIYLGSHQLYQKKVTVKEYTILAVFSVLLTCLLDRKSRVRVLERKEFYLFLSIILIFKFLVNGYLTGKNIVMYDSHFFMCIRIGSIPIEDFLFGFSMVTLTVIFWEHFKAKFSLEKR